MANIWRNINHFNEDNPLCSNLHYIFKDKDQNITLASLLDVSALAILLSQNEWVSICYNTKEERDCALRVEVENIIDIDPDDGIILDYYEKDKYPIIFRQIGVDIEKRHLDQQGDYIFKTMSKRYYHYISGFYHIDMNMHCFVSGIFANYLDAEKRLDKLIGASGDRIKPDSIQHSDVDISFDKAISIIIAGGEVERVNEPSENEDVTNKFLKYKDNTIISQENNLDCDEYSLINTTSKKNIGRLMKNSRWKIIKEPSKILVDKNILSNIERIIEMLNHYNEIHDTYNDQLKSIFSTLKGDK